MKTLILASAIGLSTLMLAGCVSEGVSYEDNGYYSRPRDYSERYNRNERWRDRGDYSEDRDYRRSRRNNDEDRADWRDREDRGKVIAVAATIRAAKFRNTTRNGPAITAAADGRDASPDRSCSGQTDQRKHQRRLPHR